MMFPQIHRRGLLVAGMAALTLAACGGEAPPVVLSVAASGSAGMNAGPDGADRPVTLSILQMSGSGAFNAADYFALQDPAAALGAELVQADQMILSPGGSVSKAITLKPGVTAIGVVAGFRSPTGRNVRQLIPAPAASTTLTITVGSGGISATAG